MEILLSLIIILLLLNRKKQDKEPFRYSIPRNPYSKYKEFKNIVKNVDITYSTVLENLSKKQLRYVSDRTDSLLFSPINSLPIDICPISVDGIRYKKFSGQEFDRKFLSLGKYLIDGDKISINPNWKTAGLSEKERRIILRIDGSSEYSLEELDEIFSYDFISGIELNLYSKNNTLPKFIINNLHISEQNELLKNKIKEISNLPNFKNRQLIFGLGISYFSEDFMNRLSSINIDFIHFYKSDLSKDVLDDFEKCEKYISSAKHIILNDSSMCKNKFIHTIFKYKISGGSFSVRNFKFHHKILSEFSQEISILKKRIGF